MARLRTFVLKSILALIILILAFLASLAIIACFPYRVIVQIIAKLFRRDLIKIQTGMSHIFSIGKILTGTQSSNIAGFVVVDGDVPISRFQEIFQKRILDATGEDGRFWYKKLWQNYTGFMGYSFVQKIKNKFDITDHVRDWDFEDLPLPVICTEDDFEKVAFEYLGKPWKAQGGSPWEVVLVHGFKSKTPAPVQMLICFRIDHTFADGFSLYLLFERLFGQKDKVVIPKGLPLTSGQKLKIWLIFPFKLWLHATDYFYQLAYGRVTQWQKKHYSMRYYSVLSDPVDVNTIKRIKNAYNINYFVVTAAAIAEALYRVHRDVGIEIAPQMRLDFPQPRYEHPGGLTNHMYGGVLVVKLKEAHTLEDLRDMNKRYLRIRSSLIREATNLLFIFTNILPIQLWSILFHFYKPSGLLLGNIPVNTEEIRFEGHLASGGWTGGRMMYPKAPIGAAAMTFGINSQQRFHFGIEQNCFPDEKVFKRMGPYVLEAINRMHLECSV